MSDSLSTNLIFKNGVELKRSPQILSKSTTLALSPALVETYCRLTVYSEIESLGVKSVLTQLFPQIFKESAWQMLHVILEIFSYRRDISNI